MVMAHKSVTRRVTETLADATGRSDGEVRLALTGAVVATVGVLGLRATVRVVRVLADLGTDVFDRHKQEIRVPRPRGPHELAAAPDRGDVRA
jgi:hypothetical protein